MIYFVRTGTGIVECNKKREKVMRQVIYMITIVIFFAVGCTKNNYIDTGVSNGRHEGKNLLEYMETDS